MLANIKCHEKSYGSPTLILSRRDRSAIQPWPSSPGFRESPSPTAAWMAHGDTFSKRGLKKVNIAPTIKFWPLSRDKDDFFI